MEEQLILFETAKLANKKKFDWPCVISYTKIGKIEYYQEKGLYSATTQSLLQKWLREKFCIHVNVNPLHLSEGYRQQAYSVINKKHKGKYTTHSTYEEALEKGLQEALKLI